MGRSFEELSKVMGVEEERMRSTDRILSLRQSHVRRARIPHSILPTCRNRENARTWIVIIHGDLRSREWLTSEKWLINATRATRSVARSKGTVRRLSGMLLSDKSWWKSPALSEKSSLVFIDFVIQTQILHSALRFVIEKPIRTRDMQYVDWVY